MPEAAGSRPASPTVGARKGYPSGDGTRLERGRAMSLAGSTPAPSAVERPSRRCPWCNGSTRAVDLAARVRLPPGTLVEPEGVTTRRLTTNDGGRIVTRGVLLGEQRASKLATGFESLHPCSRRDVAEGRGACLVSGHAGSSPAVGLTQAPSECDGFARDPAKVVDQVRLLARTSPSRRRSQTARRPAATRFKWVRLPPASLAAAPRPPHDFQASDWCRRPTARRPRPPTIGPSRPVNGIETWAAPDRGSSEVEHRAH